MAGSFSRILFRVILLVSLSWTSGWVFGNSEVLISYDGNQPYKIVHKDKTKRSTLSPGIYTPVENGDWVLAFPGNVLRGGTSQGVITQLNLHKSSGNYDAIAVIDGELIIFNVRSNAENSESFLKIGPPGSIDDFFTKTPLLGPLAPIESVSEIVVSTAFSATKGEVVLINLHNQKSFFGPGVTIMVSLNKDLSAQFPQPQFRPSLLDFGTHSKESLGQIGAWDNGSYRVFSQNVLNKLMIHRKGEGPVEERWKEEIRKSFPPEVVDFAKTNTLSMSSYLKHSVPLIDAFEGSLRVRTLPFIEIDKEQVHRFNMGPDQSRRGDTFRQSFDPVTGKEFIDYASTESDRGVYTYASKVNGSFAVSHSNDLDTFIFFSHDGRLHLSESGAIIANLNDSSFGPLNGPYATVSKKISTDHGSDFVAIVSAFEHAMSGTVGTGTVFSVSLLERQDPKSKWELSKQFLIDGGNRKASSSQLKDCLISREGQFFLSGNAFAKVDIKLVNLSQSSSKTLRFSYPKILKKIPLSKNFQYLEYEDNDPDLQISGIYEILESNLFSHSRQFEQGTLYQLEADVQDGKEITLAELKETFEIAKGDAEIRVRVHGLEGERGPKLVWTIDETPVHVKNRPVMKTKPVKGVVVVPPINSLKDVNFIQMAAHNLDGDLKLQFFVSVKSGAADKIFHYQASLIANQGSDAIEFSSQISEPKLLPNSGALSSAEVLRYLVGQPETREIYWPIDPSVDIYDNTFEALNLSNGSVFRRKHSPNTALTNEIDFLSGSSSLADEKDQGVWKFSRFKKNVWKNYFGFESNNIEDIFGKFTQKQITQWRELLESLVAPSDCKLNEVVLFESSSKRLEFLRLAGALLKMSEYSSGSSWGLDNKNLEIFKFPKGPHSPKDLEHYSNYFRTVESGKKPVLLVNGQDLNFLVQANQDRIAQLKENLKYAASDEIKRELFDSHEFSIVQREFSKSPALFLLTLDEWTYLSSIFPSDFQPPSRLNLHPQFIDSAWEVSAASLREFKNLAIGRTDVSSLAVQRNIFRSLYNTLEEVGLSHKAPEGKILVVPKDIKQNVLDLVKLWRKDQSFKHWSFSNEGMKLFEVPQDLSPVKTTQQDFLGNLRAVTSFSQSGKKSVFLIDMTTILAMNRFEKAENQKFDARYSLFDHIADDSPRVDLQGEHPHVLWLIASGGLPMSTTDFKAKGRIANFDSLIISTEEELQELNNQLRLEDYVDFLTQYERITLSGPEISDKREALSVLLETEEIKNIGYQFASSLNSDAISKDSEPCQRNFSPIFCQQVQHYC